LKDVLEIPNEIMKKDGAEPLREICLPDHSGEAKISMLVRQWRVSRYREWNVLKFSEASRMRG